MKNTNRVQSDYGEPAPAPQSKSNYPKAAITVYDFEADNTITQQNLSRRDFAAIQSAAKNAGLTLKQFIKAAIVCALQAPEEFRPEETREPKRQPNKSSKPTGECDEYAPKTNYRIKLDLTRHELHAVRTIVEHVGLAKKYRTPASGALFALTVALVHWNRLVPLVLAHQRYCAAEAVELGRFRDETISRKFNFKIPVDKRGRVPRNKN